MAKIKSFMPKNRDLKMKGVKEVNCEFYVGYDENGVKYIALSTTGEKGNSVNQTLHIDAINAKKSSKYLLIHFAFDFHIKDVRRMTVQTIAGALNLAVLSGDGEALSRPVAGGYCGDLLSWVMGRAPQDGVWITIMSNLNVAAVAELADISCVVLAEGVAPDPPLLERAKADNLALLQSKEPSFTLAGKIFALLNG